MAPAAVDNSLVRTVTEEGEFSWEKCLAASAQKLLGKGYAKRRGKRLVLLDITSKVVCCREDMPRMVFADLPFRRL